MAEAQRTELLRFLIFELYYPVGFANELRPALHALHSIGVDRLPGWTHWLLAELHVCLSRSINKAERQSYMKNAYRVLMTRARQGMVICVPEGNDEDPTRAPCYYDTTFEYFQCIGLRVLD